MLRGASSESLPAREKNRSWKNAISIFVEQQRTEIIEALQHVSDEWILKAVARLLGLDAPIPECHRRILNSRLDAYECREARNLPKF